MRTFFLAATLLVSSSVDAQSVIRQPDGARIAPAQADARGPQAKLACDLYEFAVKEGNLGESRHLKRQESQTFKVGAFFLYGVQFPEPYEKIQVAINSFMVSYLESPEQENHPYIQAFYVLNGSPLKDTYFEFKNISPGDKIAVRDTYRFSDSIMLTFQCGIELL